MEIDSQLITNLITLNIGLIVVCICLIGFLIYFIKKYISFMRKLGKGDNIDEMLKVYIDKVNEIHQENEQIQNYCIKLDNDVDSSIQKIGIVRFNAFKDVGSNLSFALAMLDRQNNGVVLNGIYGSEYSNIYAKPIKNARSEYQLSDEEINAIDLALQSNVYKKK